MTCEFNFILKRFDTDIRFAEAILSMPDRHDILQIFMG